jgi:hypothetical protein
MVAVVLLVVFKVVEVEEDSFGFLESGLTLLDEFFGIVIFIVVKMGKNNEDNDSKKFIKQSQAAFEESERVFLDLYDFENYKKDDGDHSLFY